MNKSQIFPLIYSLPDNVTIYHFLCTEKGNIIELNPPLLRELHNRNIPRPASIFEIIPKIREEWISDTEQIVRTSTNLFDKVLIVLIKRQGDEIAVTAFPDSAEFLQESVETLIQDSILSKNIKDFVFYLDSNQGIISCNDAFSQVLKGGEDIVGDNIDNYLHNPPSYEIISKILNTKKKIDETEICLRGLDGNNIFGLAAIHRLESSRGYADLLFIKDISKRVNILSNYMKTSVELMKANEKLKNTQTTLFHQEKMASIGQLAAGLAHEINNPLSYISNNILTLQRYIESTGRYIKAAQKMHNETAMEREITLEHLKTMEKAMDMEYIFSDTKDLIRENEEGLNKISTILKSLKIFADTEEKDQRHLHDLNQSINAILNITKNEYKYNINIKSRLGEIPKTICDSHQINQAILNIFMNSIEAIKHRNTGRMGNISFETFADSDFISLIISDDGPGINPEIINNVTSPFFSTKEVGKGTGLGLSIAHTVITDKHGGELLIESPGEGTKVTIRLPIVIDL